MKTIIQSIFSSGSVRGRAFFIILILNIVSVSTSTAQSISSQVNSYIKTQVKETTVRGAILVAENMTDWLSHTNEAPITTKKSTPAVPGLVCTPAPRIQTVAVKTKCTVGAKPIKRT